MSHNPEVGIEGLGQKNRSFAECSKSSCKSLLVLVFCIRFLSAAFPFFLLDFSDFLQDDGNSFHHLQDATLAPDLLPELLQQDVAQPGIPDQLVAVDRIEAKDQLVFWVQIRLAVTGFEFLVFPVDFLFRISFLFQDRPIKPFSNGQLESDELSEFFSSLPAS